MGFFSFSGTSPADDEGDDGSATYGSKNVAERGATRRTIVSSPAEEPFPAPRGQEEEEADRQVVVSSSRSIISRPEMPIRSRV